MPTYLALPYCMQHVHAHVRLFAMAIIDEDPGEKNPFWVDIDGKCKAWRVDRSICHSTCYYIGAEAEEVVGACD